MDEFTARLGSSSRRLLRPLSTKFNGLNLVFVSFLYICICIFIFFYIFVFEKNIHTYDCQFMWAGVFTSRKIFSFIGMVQITSKAFDTIFIINMKLKIDKLRSL